jgi:predicted O-methyltransferase YrrM
MTDAISPDQSAKMQLMMFTRGFMVSKSLQAAAEIGIADLVNESSKSCEELAQLTATHGPSLYRLLSALVGLGIFQEDEQGRFINTPLSELLRSDTPDSLRDHIMYMPHEGNVRAWMGLTDTLRTGKAAFEEANNGLPLWEYLKERPELEQRFDKVMTRLSELQSVTVTTQCDFTGFGSLLDIGGGQGVLLAKILQSCPHLQGALLERDSVAERAKEYLEAQGLAERCEVVKGSFMEDIPRGYDAYTMKQVLHNWGDAEALQILRRCREAMPEHGTLFIFDTVMMPDNVQHPAKWLDLHMLVTLGGKERTAQEFAALLAEAGLRMKRAVPGEGIGIVEAVLV